MADGISARVERGEDGLRLRLQVHDPKFAGKSARFEIEQRVRVKRSSPVHKSRRLAGIDLQLRHGEQELRLGDLDREAFAYTGEDIDIELKGQLEIDDGVIFDTEIDVGLESHEPLPPRQKAGANHKAVHSPRDSFDFIANLRAIPAKARLMVIWLMLVGIPVVVGNALLGVRDEFVPESQVWFYDHSGDDGSESPIMKALMGSGAAGLALWVAIRRQLQKYMEFSAKLPDSSLCRDGSCRPGDIFSGRARVALQGAVVRLVAYNREHGQYTRTEKNGKSSRTVTESFTSPARGIVLYEQLLAHVPAEAQLSGYLAGEIRFEPLFEALYPPTMIGGSHGLSIQLEGQLLHPDFVDHDIELPVSGIEIGDFYAAKPRQS